MNEKQRAQALANLRPFKPGLEWRGNPSGRPLSKPLTDRYNQALELELPANVRKQLRLPKGAKIGDGIAMNIALRASNPKHVKAVEAAREIREAIEGKAPLAVDHRYTGTVKLEVEYVNRRQSQATLDSDTGQLISPVTNGPMLGDTTNGTSDSGGNGTSNSNN